jgi:S1-C subfamily serine protease
VRRSYIGIGGQNIDLPRKFVRHFNLSVEKAVLIVGLEEKGPAYRAGVREGDVLLEFEGQPVQGMDDLHRLLTDEKVGVESIFSIARRSEKLNFQVTPEEYK